ncbi:MAG TPA: ATP synthase F1 subunit gamma [bacterium]|nr:ATP synthase F1 subunit gamma [bacterium]
MASLRDIKRRITSVRNTRQITSAMRMVSAAKLNRAQIAVRRAQPYATAMRQIVWNVGVGMTEEDSPFFRQAESGKSLVAVFTSDRTLCGSFNSGLNRFLERNLREHPLPELELFTFGRVGHDYFRRRGFSIRDSVLFATEAQRRDRIFKLVYEITDRFSSGELGRVYVAYNHYINPIRQEQRLVQLLPIAPLVERRAEPRSMDVIFEPTRGDVLGTMLQRYLRDQIYIAHLNTEAGEHGARMAAMEGATKNAEKMIASYTLQYNRARQAAITKELIEIVNGAQSL